MTDLKGKTALVTGSTSGIGRAAGVALAARGAHVLVTGRSEQRAAAVVTEIEEGGGIATSRLITLAYVASARELAKWATQAGGGHIDIQQRRHRAPGTVTVSHRGRLRSDFTINVKIPFFLVAALAPAMTVRGWGAIVNVSTMVASFGQPGIAMYGASRAASR